MGLKIETKDSQLTGEVTLEFEICGNSSFVLNVACYPKAWGSLMPQSLNSTEEIVSTVTIIVIT